MRIAPFLRRILNRRRETALDAVMWVPAGHFYSPLPSVQEVKRREQQIFAAPPAST
jgi:hypothetical protein